VLEDCAVLLSATTMEAKVAMPPIIALISLLLKLHSVAVSFVGLHI